MRGNISFQWVTTESNQQYFVGNFLHLRRIKLYKLNLLVLLKCNLSKFIQHCTWYRLSLGLSTRALKTNSLVPDLRSRFNVVACELHTPHRLRALHCLTGSHALSHSTPRSSDLDRGRVEAKWSLDADPRSRVKSSTIHDSNLVVSHFFNSNIKNYFNNLLCMFVIWK